MISKVLSLLLTVLLVTSLFVPAVAANYDIDDGTSNPTITPEEALEFRIEHGYLTEFTVEGVGYWYRGANVWIIYTDYNNFFTLNADNDEKRMKLLEFMLSVDNQHTCDVGGPALGTLLVCGGALCIMFMNPAFIVPALVFGGEAIATGIIAISTRFDSNCRALAEELRSLK